MNDPFAILGLPRRYELDLADLHKRFIQASAANHPDRFTDPQEQADAADASASINAAYRTLLNPESRAAALLELLSGPDKKSDSSLPPAFLMEVMDVRERLDDAVDAKDQAALADIRQWAHEQRSAHLALIAEHFSAIASAPDASANARLALIRLELNVLRYFERMLEQMPAE